MDGNENNVTILYTSYDISKKELIFLRDLRVWGTD
jgi:hypothetical protein